MVLELFNTQILKQINKIIIYELPKPNKIMYNLNPLEEYEKMGNYSTYG